MKKLMLITLIAGLTGTAWAETPVDAQIEKAVQRLAEGEAQNSQEVNTEAQAIQQAAKSATTRVKKALTPLAKRLEERVKAEAPAIIDAAAEQRRASSKLLTGCLSVLRKAVDEVAK